MAYVTAVIEQITLCRQTLCRPTRALMPARPEAARPKQGLRFDYYSICSIRYITNDERSDRRTAVPGRQGGVNDGQHRVRRRAEVSGDPAVHEGLLQETGTARAGQASRAVPAAIEVSHLTKVFGGRTAVSDVSFTVASGEVFGFLGPNGAGKTTTVRTLGTLIAPSSGSAIVAGIPLNAKNGPAIRSRISVMPESPGLYLRLTVLENLECFAGLYELDDVRGRIGRALRAVNLEDRARD